ncbi:MAG: hypothetical protein N6V49_00410 [Serratia symbiotica]|nr:hypothetical protein [Serratia symbiotica]
MQAVPSPCQRDIRIYPIRLFYLPFCTWAVLTLLTDFLYAVRLLG